MNPIYAHDWASNLPNNKKLRTWSAHRCFDVADKGIYFIVRHLKNRMEVSVCSHMYLI